MSQAFSVRLYSTQRAVQFLAYASLTATTLHNKKTPQPSVLTSLDTISLPGSFHRLSSKKSKKN